MDIKDLKSLVKLITDTDITEFEMQNGEDRIAIRRGQPQGAVQVVTAAPVVAASAPVVQPAAVEAQAPVAAASEGAISEKHEKIASPMVGTFYRAPSPDSPNYVEVGQVVEKGQSLCIVEAMKLMNEIEAEFKCRIIEILKENTHPVEYGEPLFLVERL